MWNKGDMANTLLLSFVPLENIATVYTDIINSSSSYVLTLLLIYAVIIKIIQHFTSNYSLTLVMNRYLGTVLESSRFFVHFIILIWQAMFSCPTWFWLYCISLLLYITDYCLDELDTYQMKISPPSTPVLHQKRLNSFFLLDK